MYLNRVESIVYDDILREKRAMSLEDYEEYCDEKEFHDTTDLNDPICTIEELQSAIKRINREMEV